MIQLLRLTNPEKLNSVFKRTYESLFPPNERRELDQLFDLLGNTQFKLYEIYLQEKFVGFISVWDLTEFNFIEHFAICAPEQGKGYGTRVLSQLLSMDSKPFILEVEEPLTETAQKRISFYERLNFSLNSGSYFQPPYSIEKSSIKMQLMSYPITIEPEDFERIKAKIHDQVYGFGS
jgi:GNAT superfamily N-acetyltransferase